MLDQVLPHAAAEHGMPTPTLPFIESVMTHTHPVIPPRNRPHLRVVGPDAGAHSGAAGGSDHGERAGPNPGHDNSDLVVAGPRPVTTGPSGHVLPANVYPLRRVDRGPGLIGTGA